MARDGPRRSVRKAAMASTEPLASISLPNSAPSRNSGKNCATNVAAVPMKICVQLASTGCPASTAASSAQSGARIRMDQPR